MTTSSPADEWSVISAKTTAPDTCPGTLAVRRAVHPGRGSGHRSRILRLFDPDLRLRAVEIGGRHFLDGVDPVPVAVAGDLGQLPHPVPVRPVRGRPALLLVA